MKLTYSQKSAAKKKKQNIILNEEQLNGLREKAVEYYFLEKVLKKADDKGRVNYADYYTAVRKAGEIMNITMDTAMSILTRHIPPTVFDFKNRTVNIENARKILDELIIELNIDKSAESPYRCLRCNAKFMTIKKMRKHLIERHNQDLIYFGDNYVYCGLCGKPSRDQIGLESHLRRTHNLKIPFSLYKY